MSIRHVLKFNTTFNINTFFKWTVRSISLHFFQNFMASLRFVNWVLLAHYNDPIIWKETSKMTNVVYCLGKLLILIQSRLYCYSELSNWIFRDSLWCNKLWFYSETLLEGKMILHSTKCNRMQRKMLYVLRLVDEISSACTYSSNKTTGQ